MERKTNGVSENEIFDVIKQTVSNKFMNGSFNIDEGLFEGSENLNTDIDKVS